MEPAGSSRISSVSIGPSWKSTFARAARATCRRWLPPIRHASGSEVGCPMKSLARWQSALLLVVPVLLPLGCEQRTATTSSAAAPKGASGTTVGGSPPAPAQGAIRRGIDRQTAQNHFSQLGLFYFQYQTEMGRSPPNLQSFGEYIKRDAPQIYQAIQ